MPRFFFHPHNDLDATDHGGQELPDVNAAIARATAYARDMAAESVREGKLTLSHFIDVADESGVSLCRVTFAEAVRISE
jgi:hypothetical protein